jgi:medium-chain acyl-[acyl-carrier-protein] hydrolase
MVYDISSQANTARSEARAWRKRDECCLICFETNPAAKLRLICFPYAGGAATAYRDWPSLLPSNVETWAVQLPGRGNRIDESPCADLWVIVRAIVGALSRYLDKPLVFFGHSLGALVGFEVAHAIRNDYSVELGHLFVSGRTAPHLPNERRVTYDLPEKEFIQELRRLNGTPKDVLEDEELIQIIAPMLRADFKLSQTYDYTPRPPLSCPITAFAGLLDADSPLELIEGWGEQTKAAFSLRVLPGDHFFLHGSRETLLNLISEDLNRL